MSGELETAGIAPASGGFGLWQLQEWQSQGQIDLGDFAADNGYRGSDSPGERYHGLIQGESEAEGWLITEGDPEAEPLAYRIRASTEHLGDKLHHVDGTHRTTPPTASGRALTSHQTALEAHMADGHTHKAPTHIVDTEGRTAEQFLAETFEFERCGECGGDAPDHEAIPVVLGAYGGPYFWARCKHEVAECVHCGSSISRRPMDASGFPGYWFHADSQLTPCDPSKVNPEAYSDCEGDKYDIATPREEVDA